MNNKEKNTKNILGLLIFAVLISAGFLYQNNKEKGLLKNRRTCVGKVIDLKKGPRGRGSIVYKYYVNGKLYETSGPDNGGGWPKHIRKVRAQKGKYYIVEYDSNNPIYSKIVIDRNSRSHDELLYSGVKKLGIVEKAYEISENYYDLYIKYSFDNNDFKFRTRLHKDSLTCKTAEACTGASIELKFSPEFPALNDLYHKSYDRIKRIEAKNRK